MQMLLGWFLVSVASVPLFSKALLTCLEGWKRWKKGSGGREVEERKWRKGKGKREVGKKYEGDIRGL